MKDRVGHLSGVRLEGLQYQQESLLVSCHESGKSSDFLQRLIVFDVGELESSDERCKSFCAESVRDLVYILIRIKGPHLRGFLSMKVMSLRCDKNEGGVSEMTCRTFMRVWKSECPWLLTSDSPYLQIFYKAL